MSPPITGPALAFLLSQESAVLSTVSRDGRVQGASVYYRYYRGKIYILTKSDSAKAHSMLSNHQVALTIYNADQIKTIQLEGDAEIEGNLQIKSRMFEQLVQPRMYEGEQFMPPVTQLDASGFIIFGITPTVVHYTDYKDKSRIIPHNHRGSLI